METEDYGVFWFYILSSYDLINSLYNELEYVII